MTRVNTVKIAQKFGPQETTPSTSKFPSLSVTAGEPLSPWQVRPASGSDPSLAMQMLLGVALNNGQSFTIA